MKLEVVFVIVRDFDDAILNRGYLQLDLLVGGFLFAIEVIDQIL